MKTKLHFSHGKTGGLTLVELLVSMTVVVLLMMVLAQTTDMVQRTWRSTTGGIEQFREAREALEAMTRHISQATLNTYWDYDNPANPQNYRPQSDLRFRTGPTETVVGSSSTVRPGNCIFFQAPTGIVTSSTFAGLQNLMNTWGYYVEWNSDSDFWPPFMKNLTPRPRERWRFRLMELVEPADTLSIYKYTSGADSATKGSKNTAYGGNEWFAPLVTSGTTARVLAENVLFIQVAPLKSHTEPLGTGDNSYDSNPVTGGTNASLLPPYVHLSLVTVDDAAFERYQLVNGGANGATAPSWLKGKSLGWKNAEYEKTLADLEETLTKNHIPYREFSVQIPLRSAKWTQK
jgi:uncharacterized protein (TIGR02599 family)